MAERSTREPGSVPAGDAARTAAADVLRAVEDGVDWGDAWRRARPRVPASARDRRFAHELACGALRLRGRMDWILERHTRRPLQEVDPEILRLLRLGLYQALEMRTVGDAAAVHTTVELAKRRAPRGATFVNAVLRAALRDRERLAYPDPEREPVAHLVARGSHPSWIVERWYARFGFAATAALCDYDNRRPELCLRVRAGGATRDELIGRLPGSRAGRWSEAAIRCPSAAYAPVREIVRQGLASVQDESAMLVAPLLSPVPGERVIDLAAAPGGKTCHLAELLKGEGEVLACDRDPRRLVRLRDNVERLRLGNVAVVQADARRLETAPADAVLLDAPCTGLGVLGRRPDARWRKRPEDPTRLRALQEALLETAARHVRVGGRLVYSVCSFEPEETTAVAAAFAAAHPEFEPDDAGLQDELRSGPGILYFFPHLHGLDGGFVARWRRRA